MEYPFHGKVKTFLENPPSERVKPTVNIL